MKMGQWSGVALAGMLVLGGCSSYHHHGMAGGAKSDAYWQRGQKDMDALIDRTVKDQAKAKQVKDLVAQIIAELKAGREHERAYHRQLYTLNASYTATRDEFAKILDEANNERMRTASKILDFRFKMKELMTADEWKALSDQMLSYTRKYQHGGNGNKSGY